ncbi:hypothetical protein P886_4776 [Alteromonadaceae bacterium 2753L.S.0a.02]|nr:hypothetical protein P886_4776 [Alteromonadaceae bacterium 2753L.S.0a.02]
MGLTEMVELVKSNIDFLPQWFTGIFWHLVSALLIIYLLTAFFNAVSSQSFINPVRSVFQLSGRIVRSAFTGYVSGLQSPIVRPKSRLVGLALGLVHTYFMSVLFFIFTAVVFLLLVINGKSLPLLNQFGGLGILFFFFSLSWYFRSQADREWLALKEQWRVVRNG